MANYNNRAVVQSLRQYDMFKNSLNLVKSREEKNMIIKQLTKLETKIIEQTNETYEEDYYALANKECDLLDDEKRRVSALIELINQRLSYIEKRCTDHYQLTGETLDITDVLGANTLDTLENRIKIIDKYNKNLKLEEDLKDEVKTLSNKISLVSEKIDINKSLNKELETKFTDLLSRAFEKLNLFSLLDSKDEIEFAYYETEKSLKLAKENLNMALSSPINVLKDCEEMLKEVQEDYDIYKEKISLLKLMDIFNREVTMYSELLDKRNEINELFKYIKNEEFLSIVSDTVNNQYHTISMEQQDINTYNDLSEEKERKLEALAEIEEENESEEFQKILRVLIENEKRKQAKILEEKRRIEEQEKKKKLELERKKQEEMLKRQKIIEEARKKEIEKRTKQLLVEQQNSVLQSNKKAGYPKEVSFETIKGISDNSSLEVNEDGKQQDNLKLDFSKIDMDVEENSFKNIKSKNKIDIEKELFEEFNSQDEDKPREDNKLPLVSIDEYMKNFDENEIAKSDSFFGDNDIFPNIPM